MAILSCCKANNIFSSSKCPIGSEMLIEPLRKKEVKVKSIKDERRLYLREDCF